MPGENAMSPDAIRGALAMVYLALAEATALATGKPVEQLANRLMRGMAECVPPETADLCPFLADGTGGELANEVLMAFADDDLTAPEAASMYRDIVSSIECERREQLPSFDFLDRLAVA